MFYGTEREVGTYIYFCSQSIELRLWQGYEISFLKIQNKNVQYEISDNCFKIPFKSSLKGIVFALTR